MNRVCALPAIFLLGSLAGIAQSSSPRPAAAPMDQSGASAVLRIPPPSADNCPLRIQVTQGGIPRLIYIKTAPPEGTAVGLGISVRNSRSVGIVTVQIIVRGYTRTHASSADVSNSTPRLAAKSFVLPLKAAPGGTASTELWVKGFVSVTSVELTGVAYADGSAWHATKNRRCRISSILDVAGASR